MACVAVITAYKGCLLYARNADAPILIGKPALLTWATNSAPK